MARRKKNKKYTVDSSLARIKAQFEDKMLYLSRSGLASNVRERLMPMNFRTLRRIGERLSIANMCINCREQQVMPFLEPAKEVGVPGFIITKRGKFDKRFKQEDKRAMELTEFVQQTGFIYDPDREDDFVDFGKMFMRETLMIDQVAVEMQRNRRGEVAAFWVIDGSTISRCFQNNKREVRNLKSDTVFVQEIEGKITAEYSREDLIFDYMFKRADIRYRGYGYSLLEQAVDLVTTLILGISYNRDLFVKDKIPKGFIALQGEADRQTIEALERYWYMAMSGVGARFTIPILPSGKDGVSMDYKMLGQSNRDMEYHKLMLFFLSLFAAVFGIDLAELGIKTDNTQQVLGENVEGRIQYSKDRGLTTSLGFLRGFMNKIIRKVDEDYDFIFVGINPEDEVKKYEIATKAIASTRTINEMREEDGLNKLEGEEYDMVLNQNLIQAKQMIAGQQRMQEQIGGEEWEEEETEEGVETGKEEVEEGEEEVEKAIADLEEHIEELRKAGYEMEINV